MALEVGSKLKLLINVNFTTNITEVVIEPCGAMPFFTTP